MSIRLQGPIGFSVAAVAAGTLGTFTGGNRFYLYASGADVWVRIGPTTLAAGDAVTRVGAPTACDFHVINGERMGPFERSPLQVRISAKTLAGTTAQLDVDCYEEVAP
jgi:precorrin-3B methylase